MPRARGSARKTYPRRRVKRYRTKWTHHVIPRRFKVLLPFMWSRLQPELELHVECEEPTIAELQVKGVPEAEWPYYLGYMKRMLALYENFTGATLQLEKTNLIEEYVLRGKERHVLEQVQVVAERCYLECEDVLACIEPDYSTYAVLWTVNDPENEATGSLFFRLNYNGDTVFIWDEDNARVLILNRTTGAMIASIATQNTFQIKDYVYACSFRKYVVFVDPTVGIRVYRDGVHLANYCADWAGDLLHLAMSMDGQYILVLNVSPTPIQWRLLEGR